MHFNDELIGVKLRSVGDTDHPFLDLAVYSRTRVTSKLKELVKDGLNDLLGVGDDLVPFYDFASKDSILKHTIIDRYGMHDTYSPSLFARATLAILLQMTGIKRSNQMMNAVINNYGQIAEFNGKRVRVWPTQECLSKLTPRQLAKTCNVGYRAKSLVKLARVMVKSNGPTMIELRELPREEAKHRLMELPGIGDYSSDIINRPGGFPIDVWSAAVFGKLFYGKEPTNSREAVEEVKAEGIRRWGQWAWMAFFYVVQDLENLSQKLNVSLRLE